MLDPVREIAREELRYVGPCGQITFEVPDPAYLRLMIARDDGFHQRTHMSVDELTTALFMATGIKRWSLVPIPDAKETGK